MPYTFLKCLISHSPHTVGVDCCAFIEIHVTFMLPCTALLFHIRYV